MKQFRYTYQLLTALTLITWLGGCTQDDSILAPGGEEPDKCKTTLVLKMDTPATSTKANATTLSGTDKESALNRLDLFIAQNGKLVKTYSKAGSNLQSPVVFILESNDITAADIYVAANMTQAQADAITANDLNPAIGITDIAETTGAGGFLMTGKVTGKVTIEKEKITTASITLDRVVSKILLTCDTKDGNGNYVNLADNRNGYIKLSDVHYELANTNRKLYPFAKESNEDPNYAVNEGLLGNLPHNFFTGNAVTPSSKAAVKYVASKVDMNDENRYTDVLYCLENTVNMADFTSTYESSLSIARQVGTYVKISARFTPAFIDNFENLSEDEAQAKLSDGTFYTYKKAAEGKKHICYSSLETGMHCNEGSREEDFTEYAGGRLTYETFVASPSGFNAESNLKRNNYYIMHITSMTAPIREKTIEVNTIVAGWTRKGTTVIDIETHN